MTQLLDPLPMEELMLQVIRDTLLLRAQETREDSPRSPKQRYRLKG